MDVGLIFGMIVAIFVIIAVLIFGYDQIVTMQELQQEAEFLRTMQSFENAVDSTYNLGGESSKRFTMSFPSGSVTRTCIVPQFSKDCYPAPCIRVPYDNDDIENEVEDLLRQQLGYGFTEARDISEVMASAWKSEEPSVLVFYVGKRVPVWFSVPHLEPVRVNNHDEIFCANPSVRVVLKRHSEDAGAWVAVVEF